MAQRFTVETFKNLQNNMIGCGLNDKMMDHQFELIEKDFNKGSLYTICRRIWNYFCIINTLKRSNVQLEEENKKLREQIDVLKKQKVVVNTTISSSNEEWIDNGHPSNFPKPNDGWM